jgi:lipopolysaccharide heptosyltransferase I
LIRCLIIKTTSLGDIIHTLPALTDAVNALGEIQFDWVVEESFSEIPAWHPAVNKVIPVAIRRWRKNFFKSIFGSEWKYFKQQIKKQHYDVVIDAQGLLKSALLTRLAKGNSYGFDRSSAREPIASHFYRHPQSISRNQHAVERVRQLFAKSLGYNLTKSFDYGIKNTFKAFTQTPGGQSQSLPQILFFHGTTWETKHWPEFYWLQLARLLISDGYEILLPWGNETEKQRAEMIKNKVDEHVDELKVDNAKGYVTVLPKMTLQDIVGKLSKVSAVVAVDTGLAHLAAALDIPLVSLFGPTNPGLTRPYGSNTGNQLQLQVDYACIACLKRKCSLTEVNAHSDTPNSNIISPACYSALTPDRVKKALYTLIDR